jgi:hypothetical protein
MMLMPRSVAWWYWLLSAAMLTSGVAGWHWGYCLAGTLTMVQIVHFLILERSLMAFPVQVRVGYLAILLLGIWEPMRWIYWVPMAGTWAVVLFGYCPLARLLSLMPWNRARPLSIRLVWQTITAQPLRGNVLQGLPADAGGACACSLEGRMAMAQECPGEDL